MTKLSGFNKLILFLNLFVACLLLLACFNPFAPAHSYPILSFLGLGVPLLVFANILFFVYWLLFRRKLALLSGSVLLLGFLIFGSFFKLNKTSNPKNEKDLSIMSFNIRGFDRHGLINDEGLDDKIISFVKEQAPDIVCFQEFNHRKAKLFPQYPYKYVNHVYPNTKYSVQAIFSKYPIIDNGSLDFPDTNNNAVYADITFRQDTLRVYNVHLQSFHIVPSRNLLTRTSSEKVVKRMSKAFVKQQQQASLLETHMDSSPHPVVICADMNNTEFSMAYKKLKGNRYDSFDKAGNGYGTTYKLMMYPLRIDFILVDKVFEIQSHSNFEVRLSDHFPVMASFSLKDL